MQKTNFKLGFFPKNKPRIGIKTMYRAVKKLALAAVVYIRENCWRLMAIVKTIPQILPPTIVLFMSNFSSLKDFDFFLKNIKVKYKNTTATKDLAAVKERGPKCSIPAVCATKASPQIIAVTNNIMDALNSLVIFTPPKKHQFRSLSLNWC